MKRFLKLNKTASTLVLATAVGFGSLTPAFVGAQADSSTKERIRLLSSALQARENGDLDAAKTNLENLIKITPDDSNAQRMLAQVNRDIERKSAGEPTVYGQAAAEQTFDPATADQPVAAASAEAAESGAEAVASPSARDLIAQANAALNKNNVDVAATIADQYEAAYGSDSRLQRLRTEIESVRSNPWLQNPESLSPGFEAERRNVKNLLLKARAQMLYGDLEGSKMTLREVEARDPSNAEAKALQVEILSQLSRTQWLDHKKTRDEMVQEVERSWQRPQIFERERTTGPEDLRDGYVREKLRTIEIPSVELNNVPLTRAIETLSELSVIYDKSTTDERQKGVNMLAMLGGGANPTVSLKLRHRSLETILDFLTQQVGFQWDVQNDTVVVQRSGEDSGSHVETEFFPISRATQIRITGVSEGGSSSGGSTSNNPFAPAAPAESSGSSASEVENSLKSFFERAGVAFQGTPGASLAFDGTQLIVTQTPRNLERMRTILRRYDQPKQVEIESRFLEVNQGNLDQLGFNWGLGVNNSGVRSFAGSSNRNLTGAFGINQASNSLQITQAGSPGVPGSVATVPMAPPVIPGATDLGGSSEFQFSGSPGELFPTIAGMSGMGGVMGIIGNVQLGLTIDALSRETGSDLLSSPKVTVLSGRTANITIAQELRYPESYGDMESEVGTGSTTSGGAGVTITAGTPQDFTVRNVGVEMEVTPTVEENQNISLKLEPKVTEFEGFIEYGGPSVAIQSGTTVTVPSGFYQPIFSVRSVRTEVTVFDGATVVLGGLTREEVLTIDDKVPLLGDIPILGRLFQSKGETRNKKNLLIFVTANLISPGGSPARQALDNVKPNALFQSPTIVTPTGGVNRTATDASGAALRSN